VGQTLELSEDMAKVFGIKESGLGPCQVYFPGFESCKFYIKKMVYFFFPFDFMLRVLTWIITKLE